MSKKKYIPKESIIELDKGEFENLKETIDQYDLKMYDEVKIRIHQKGGKTWGHISGYVEPEPPDDLEEDFTL
jgi:PDZ domain-containing secreted protein